MFKNKKMLAKFGSAAVGMYLLGGSGLALAATSLPPVADETVVAGNTATNPYTAINVDQNSANSTFAGVVNGIRTPAGATTIYVSAGAPINVSDDSSTKTGTSKTASVYGIYNLGDLTLEGPFQLTVKGMSGVVSAPGSVATQVQAYGITTANASNTVIGDNVKIKVDTIGGSGTSTAGIVTDVSQACGINVNTAATFTTGDNLQVELNVAGSEISTSAADTNRKQSNAYLVRTNKSVLNIGENSTFIAHVTGGTYNPNGSTASYSVGAYGLQSRGAGGVINVGNNVVVREYVTTKSTEQATPLDSRGVDVLSSGAINFLGDADIAVEVKPNVLGQQFTAHSLHAYENGVVNMNVDGGHTVKMSGDLSADGSYGGYAGGIVNIVLDTPDSYLQGNTVTKNGTMNLTISNEAEMRPIYDNRYGTYFKKADATTWSPDYKVNESTINANLVLKDNGKIDLSWDDPNRISDYRTLHITDLSGEGGKFIICTDLDSQTESDIIHVENSTGGTQYIQVRDASNVRGTQVTGEKALLIATDDSGSLSFAGKSFNNGGLWITTPTLEKRGNDWYLVLLEKSFTNDVQETVNANQGVYGLWRNIILDDTLRQRLGDMRLSGREDGIWARHTNGKLKGSGYTQRYAAYQVGYDKTDADTTYGIALDYTRSKAKHSYASGENTYTGVSLYATNYKPSGYYNDWVLRYGRVNHDLNTSGDNVDREEYGVNGYNASYEFGKTYKQDKGYYFEPEAQLVVGKLGSSSFTTDRGTKFYVNNSWTVVGRLGVVLGRQLDEHNDYYVKANIYRDFAGNRDVAFMAATNNEHASQVGEYGGTWYEFGLGTNVKLARKTDLYGDFTRSFGEEIKKDWQFNIGLKFTF